VSLNRGDQGAYSSGIQLSLYQGNKKTNKWGATKGKKNRAKDIEAFADGLQLMPGAVATKAEKGALMESKLPDRRGI